MKRGFTKHGVLMGANPIGATGPVQIPGNVWNNDPRPPVDQRLTSFLERYLIERIGKCKDGHPLEVGWEIIQDGKKIYEMIQTVGAKGV